MAQGEEVEFKKIGRDYYIFFNGKPRYHGYAWGMGDGSGRWRHDATGEVMVTDSLESAQRALAVQQLRLALKSMPGLIRLALGERAQGALAALAGAAEIIEGFLSGGDSCRKP